MLEDIIVPLIVFASLVLMVGTPFYFRHRNRRVIYDAIKTSVEKTGEADPKLISALTHDTVGPNGDLRRGILLICFALAFVVAHLAGAGDIGGAPLWAVGAFPGLIGGGYLFVHFFAPREPTI